MTDLNTLPEVISKDLFLSLLEELLQNREQHSAEEQAGQLALLGEKFQKFYDPDIINGAQRTAIFEILETATDTGRLQLMEALIGIMFQYRLDAYALYMEAYCPPSFLQLCTRKYTIQFLNTKPAAMDTIKRKCLQFPYPILPAHEK